MDKRKLRSFETLKRLRKAEMDKEAVFLAEIREEEAQLEAQKAEALEMMQRNTLEISVEHAQYVGAFIKATQRRVDDIDGRLSSLDNQARRQERVVMRTYAEFKAVDLHVEKSVEYDREQAKKIESSNYDELSILRFKRR